MKTTTETKSANYLRIIYVLRSMRDTGQITASEYRKAKDYYRKLTGADLVLAD